LRLTRKRRTIEIIVIGNELLNGTTADTNSNWFSRQLVKRGAIVTRKITVPDDLREICDAFRQAFKIRPAWIFSLGGLGPTFDDKTLKGLAFALKKKIKRNKVALEMLRESYRRRPEDLGVSKRRLPESSLKMAQLPEGSSPLQNSAGSAPAVFCTFGSSQIVALPGVSNELRAIFHEQIQPMISRSLPSFKQMQKWINVTGVGEPEIAPYIAKIMRKYSPEIYIKSHAMGFRKGRSVLKIQLTGTAPEKYSDVVCKKLADTTEQMKSTALKLGGKVELTNAAPR
jgi:nicotinamide-nucleotide amidase